MVVNQQLIHQMGLSKSFVESSQFKKMQQTANQSGLLMLEQAFAEQLQTLYDDEENEYGAGGYAKELVPLLVESAFKGSAHLGLGNEILKEMLVKTKGIGGDNGKTFV